MQPVIGYNSLMQLFSSAYLPKGLKRLTSMLGWTRSSYLLMSAFLMVLFLLGYVWWPLAEEYLSYIDWQGEWWRTFDWLLVGIFLFMSMLIMAQADLRRDWKIVLVGMCGGLVIEAWGTQTSIWSYYTQERPPLWIIPAWPIASLTIDRLVSWLGRRRPGSQEAGRHLPFPRFWQAVYWPLFAGFFGLMLAFVAPTLDKSLTWMALFLVAFLILTPTDARQATLTFLAGAGLGYFLELWGTTRQCWTYYTLETPPVFAVLAHGMAAVAFWRSALLLEMVMRVFSRSASRWVSPILRATKPDVLGSGDGE
jgi:hypothetical protein